jgi:HEAT repeat protein
MAENKSVADIVNRLPDPDQRGLLSNIDKEVVDGVTDELLEGRGESVRAVVDLLVEPGKGDDVKAHYALHCLALRVCALGGRARQGFSRTLASYLGGEKPKAVQKYLIQELQTAGGEEVVPRLGEMLLDEELCEPAARALTAIGDGACEQLAKALPQVRGKSRLTIIQNLGVLRCEEAVEALQEETHDEDRETRLAALWGLGNIGYAGSAELLLKAADTKDNWERIKATKACLLLAERLADAGKKDAAEKVYRRLHRICEGTEAAYVCEAAEAGLAQLK